MSKRLMMYQADVDATNDVERDVPAQERHGQERRDGVFEGKE